MKTKYKSINTKTLKGLKEAEKLQKTGWKIINMGLYIITFENNK